MGTITLGLSVEVCGGSGQGCDVRRVPAGSGAGAGGSGPRAAPPRPWAGARSPTRTCRADCNLTSLDTGFVLACHTPVYLTLFRTDVALNIL